MANFSKPYVKITIQDLEIAEDFFDNERHFNDFLINVFKYYRGQKTSIKTKIVQKYFNSYKKTMDFVIVNKEIGLKGYFAKAENQQVKAKTVKPLVKGVVEPNIKDINNNINNILLSEIEISDVPVNLQDYFKIAVEFQKVFIKNLEDKNIPTTNQKKAKFNNYVTPIRLMIQNKECSIQDLRDVWEYLHSPKSEFWKENILSTSKLREKIVKLIAETKKK